MKQAVVKDLYVLLGVPRNASKIEIKQAYRRIALQLHPDRNSGCRKKASSFREASEAYKVLIDVNLRREHDNQLMTSLNYKSKAAARRPNYRKVYAPQPPPGFKAFDLEKHQKMHYGNGIMEEEIEKA